MVIWKGVNVSVPHCNGLAWNSLSGTVLIDLGVFSKEDAMYGVLPMLGSSTLFLLSEGSMLAKLSAMVSLHPLGRCLNGPSTVTIFSLDHRSGETHRRTSTIRRIVQESPRLLRHSTSCPSIPWSLPSPPKKFPLHIHLHIHRFIFNQRPITLPARTLSADRH